MNSSGGSLWCTRSKKVVGNTSATLSSVLDVLSDDDNKEDDKDSEDDDEYQDIDKLDISKRILLCESTNIILEYSE